MVLRLSDGLSVALRGWWSRAISQPAEKAAVGTGSGVEATSAAGGGGGGGVASVENVGGNGSLEPGPVPMGPQIPDCYPDHQLGS